MAGEESDVELEGVDMEEDQEQEEEEEEYTPEEDTPEESRASRSKTRGAAPRRVPLVPPDSSKSLKSREWEEARKAQKERLANMRSFGTSMTGGDSKDTRERRLSYLMAQSEVFAHFMEDSMASQMQAKGGKKKKKGRTKLSEAAEDASLMKNAQSKLRVQRVEKQPEAILATLRPYQLEGLNWLVRLHDNGINGILADEMGLGKTLQTISLLTYLRESRGMSGPHICIVPKSVVNNWIREFKKWCPSTRTVKLLGSKDERQRVLREELIVGSFDVCVTSYEGVLKEKGALCKIDWEYLVIDEAHRIKNPKSSLSKVVRLIPTKFRLLITGTPLQNNLNELWALLNFLLPDIFASEDDFESWFSIEADDDAKENVVKKLHTVLRPFMLRRIKKDVETDLPPKREVKLYIGLTEMQRLWYTKILSKDAHTLNALGGPDRVQLLNILMQLRKVCNHPYLFEGAEPGPPYIDGPHLWDNAGKLVLLTKLLPKLKTQSSRVLIFSQMTRMLDILEDYMRLHGHEYCRIDGSTSGDDRDAQMDEFNAPNSSKFVFLLSTRAGGLGINLATADIVVLYDSDWNPQVDLQAMDRAHRIGQTKPVTVFRFVTEGTVEEKIVERADRKLFLDAAVIQQGRLAEQNAAMSKSDLMAMVRFGADEIFSSKQATLTDEDIDTLLKRGEERTEKQAAKIQSDVQHNLADFSLTTKDEESLFDFEGANYRDSGADRGLMINLPQRERKRNYNVDEYFQDALRPPDSSSGGQKKSQPLMDPTAKLLKDKRKGLPPMHDFQFYDKPALDAILATEDALAAKKMESLQLIKELRAQANAAHHDSRGDGAFVASESAALDAAARADELEARLDADFELSEEDAARKKQLLADGFGDWTRKDLKAYTATVETRGRDDVEGVARETAHATGKAVEDVKRYHEVFWKEYKRIADWEKTIEKIERGEKKLQRNREIRDALAAKVARHDKPWECLPLNYGPSRGKVWTEEEDAFLIVSMHQYGHQNWDRIRLEIRHAWEFSFDWFFKSRSAAELQRRAELLVRLVEKENEDVAAAADKQQQQQQNRAAAANNAPSSGGADPKVNNQDAAGSATMQATVPTSQRASGDSHAPLNDANDVGGVPPKKKPASRKRPVSTGLVGGPSAPNKRPHLASPSSSEEARQPFGRETPKPGDGGPATADDEEEFLAADDDDDRVDDYDRIDDDEDDDEDVDEDAPPDAEDDDDEDDDDLGGGGAAPIDEDDDVDEEEDDEDDVEGP